MLLIDPLLAFIIGYIALVAASIKGARAYVSIAIMIIIYIVLGAGASSGLSALEALADWNDIRVFVYIFLSLFLAGYMRETGLLDDLVSSTGAVGCRFSMMSVPAIIGLIPMPGGALVSAISLKKRFFDEAKVSPETATYVNYWFRHLWVPSWPLFQSVLITAAVFKLDAIDLISHTWPGTIAAIIGGLAIAVPLLRGVSCPGQDRRKVVYRFLRSIWPLLLLAALFMASRTPLRLVIARVYPLYGVEPMLASLILVILLVYLWKPVPMRRFRGPLSLATKPTIHLVLFESLYFKNLIIGSGAASSIEWIINKGVIPLPVLVIIIPFILGLAAGGENFFASTAMPLLLPYIATSGSTDWLLLSTAYLGGYLGVMASPVHLCLVLTVEYYKSSMGKVLGYVLGSVIISLILGILLMYLLW